VWVAELDGYPTNGGLLKWRIPKTMGFNIKNDLRLENLGVPV
jgi:hypothetical protein